MSNVYQVENFKGVENELASNLAGGDTLTGWRSWNPVVVEEINFPRLDTGYDAGTVVEPTWVGNDARKTWRSVSLWNSSNSIGTSSDYEATVVEGAVKMVGREIRLMESQAAT
ncbi:Hypothetical predicted protein [Olea europaea subsp. europaea]|uniref:Uncharacterized protein n=1 Tax=Olea europaea subsp. europaea TaxID=158383 RepID=A0A8S0QVA3_OLEEU|nr:Hypothetical predicted protein [Olea europaea subsp. europaea]